MKSHQASIQRIHRLNPRWDPSLRLSRLGTLPNSQAVTWAPQGKGVPGWLVLTRNPAPVSLFVNRTGDIQTVRIVFDERCYEDTIFRVEKTPTHLYLADLWMFNGTPIFDKTTFEERQQKLREIFGAFYIDCPAFQTVTLDLRSNLTEYKGKEYYTNDRGAKGIYIESTASDDEAIFDIVKTDIPDVYKITSNGEYLRVRTLVLSQYLKTLGHTFKMRCRRNYDGTWDPLLSSNTLTNED